MISKGPDDVSARPYRAAELPVWLSKLGEKTSWAPGWAANRKRDLVATPHNGHQFNFSYPDSLKTTSDSYVTDQRERTRDARTFRFDGHGCPREMTSDLRFQTTETMLARDGRRRDGLR